MPYCCQCGSVVGERAGFCAQCGAPQFTPAQTSPPAQPLGDYLSGISPRTASLLCYIPLVGLIAAIIVLASARFRYDPKVRFNAFQGLYLFVAWLIADWVLSPLLGWPFGGFGIYKILPALLKAAIFAAWIFMMIKTSQDEYFKLPVLGDLAEKSVAEQR